MFHYLDCNMNLVYSLINFLGLLLYGGAILGVIRALCTYDTFTEKSEWKNTLLVFIIVIAAPICGYCIRDYAQGQKRLIHFNEVLEREASKNQTNQFSLFNVSGAFSNLDSKDQIQGIEIIFNKFYNNSLQSRCSFLNEYRDYNIPYIAKIKAVTESDLETLYNSIESAGNCNQWQTLSNKVSIKDFLDNAPQHIVKKEFCKWKSDNEAWQRVVLLDSVYLSRIYLEKYPTGIHECNARKIILDDEYSKSEGRDRKINSNYCGTTTISIINRSSYEITFSCNGSFDSKSIKIPGNSQRELTIQNGYYRISISSIKLHTKGIHERITCDGGYIPYDLELKQDY